MKALTITAKNGVIGPEPERFWGAAGQVGMDYLINRDWLINMSVWYMDIDTTASYKMGGVQQRDSVRLDPWVFMFSAGYRF